MRDRLAAGDDNALVVGASVGLGEHRQRRTAFKVFLTGFDDPIVPIHPILIGVDPLQAFESP